MADFKNRLIDYALQHQYDALFLVDSDLVLHSRTLCRLVETEKDIVSEIFWTRWQPDGALLPQVWLSDEYNLFHREEGEVLSARNGRIASCILYTSCMSRVYMKWAAWEREFFGKIKNVSFWGEDRHFCIRAAAYGFPLFVDTH